MRIFSLKDFHFLSLYDHPSAEQHKDDYTPPHVRSVHISDAKISVKAGKINTKISEHKSNTNTRSVLPPRAVLSSPENDALHGTTNKTKTKTKTQATRLKNHNLCQNTHVKCTNSYELDKKRHTWK